VFTSSQLQTSPLLVLQADELGWLPSTTTKYPNQMSDYELRISDDAQTGEGPYPVGMYARCTPLKAPLVCDSYPSPTDLDVMPGDILIQYFQLFAYNWYNVTGIGNHEGDWLMLDVYVSGTGSNELKCAVYHHHGDGNCYPTVVPGSQLPLLNGVRVPFCFLEEDDHEWWPYPGASCVIDLYNICRDNKGDGVAYRADNILNLGEAFHTLPGSDTENIERQLVTYYNGIWGTDPSGPFVARCNDPTGLPTIPLFVAYVDAQAALWSGAGLGSQYFPFNTLAGGVTNVEATGHVRFTPGVYSVSSPLLISQPMTLECWTNMP
jgi:hypothetical protein